MAGPGVVRSRPGPPRRRPGPGALHRVRRAVLGVQARCAVLLEPMPVPAPPGGRSGSGSPMRGVRRTDAAGQAGSGAVLLGSLPATSSSSQATRAGRVAVMSMCVRYAGDSYTYLLDSVATDHGRAAGSPMTRYYTVAGTPPGTWLGSGLTGLDEGRGLTAGSSVTPTQMARLFADGTDPLTGGPLGRSPHVYPDGPDRRRPVAGFDCTFTVSKSVSVLWGLADDATRDAIYAAHRQAIADVIEVIERDVARTRIGTNGVAQVQTHGVIAAAFDHWDSRGNDPNLHTHVVVANRVQGPDGRWRTLDSRAIHRAAVAMSERYDALLADHLATRLGLSWEYRERGPRRNPAYELATIPPALIAEFSRRSARIDAETDRLVAAYAADHGRQPDPATVLRLRQQATLATRGVKEVHPLADLTADWGERAGRVLGTDPSGWAESIMATAATGLEREAGAAFAAVCDPDRPESIDRIIDDAATAALATLSRKRSTWTPWNAHAEASRALRAHRFADAAQRDEATNRVVGEVAARAVLLTPPEVASTPSGLRRLDGSSAFRATNAQRYTSRELLAAEARLLAAGRDRTGPIATATGGEGIGDLFDDQAAALTSIIESGRTIDVLVGPAGSGKTRTLAGMRAVWEAEHGRGSVVGLAPSAAAADVLAASLGVPTENTAKWLVEHDLEPDRLRRIERLRDAAVAAQDPTVARTLTAAIRETSAEVERWRFRPGQLVIVDEASLAATVDLDRIAACAGEAGAKLLLVGDWAQLSSVEAGGALGLLVRDRGADAPELGAARRFIHPWERETSARLRIGDPGSVDTYAEHGRIAEGDHADMVEAAWRAWTDDERAGRRSLMIAAERSTVRALNERARAERVQAGLVEADGQPLHDGLTAGIGDRIVTRRNDRRLVFGRGWVKNGDTWIVTDREPDGGLRVQRPGGGPTVDLPGEYVAEHVELGYATTAHRAQGATVDTAHAVIGGSGASREVLYVMLTRGREANHVYVATDRDVEPLTGFADEPPTGRGVLQSVLGNPGASVSAHEVGHEEREAASSIRTLAAEYETIAHLAQAPRWAAVLARAGLDPERIGEIEDSSAFGALCTALRRAEAYGLRVEAAVPRLIEGVAVGARDPAAVLHARVEAWVAGAIRAGRTTAQELVAGMIPVARGAMADDLAESLHDRERLMEQRIDVLIDRAERADAAWLADLGSRPADPSAAREWEAARRSAAAYRDRYGVTGPDPLGPEVTGDLQRAAARGHCAAAMSVARPEPSLPTGAGERRRLSTDSAALPSLRLPSAGR